MEDVIKEKLSSVRNEMTHLWSAVFVIGGGSIALLTERSLLSLLFGIVGIISAILFFNTYFLRRNEMLSLLNKLEELQK